jgi:hypothetical protein
MHTGFFHGQHEGKRPFGRSRLRWEDDIKLDLREIEIERGRRLYWSDSR